VTRLLPQEVQLGDETDDDDEVGGTPTEDLVGGMYVAVHGVMHLGCRHPEIMPEQIGEWRGPPAQWTRVAMPG
jgi:hypothetical protein